MSIFDTFTYVVGVDPGLGKTGLAIISKDGFICDATYASLSDDPMGKRLSDLGSSPPLRAYSICAPRNNKTLFCIEMNHLTSGRSAQSALKQRELIGCIRMKAWECDFDNVVDVAPASAKKALTGSGKASKDEMVEAMLGYPGSPIGLTKVNREAVADSLGAALAGADKWLKEEE